MKEGLRCPACAGKEEATLPALSAMLIKGRYIPAGKYLVGAKCHKKQWSLYTGLPASDYQ